LENPSQERFQERKVQILQRKIQCRKEKFQKSRCTGQSSVNKAYQDKGLNGKQKFKNNKPQRVRYPVRERKKKGGGNAKFKLQREI
jgi:hypothetical protein